MVDTELPVDEATTWWCLKAGRGGVLEDDWLDQNIVTTGWGDSAGDFRNVEPEKFRESDPSPQNQLSKFVGYDDDGMEAGDVVIAYAPEKGHVTGFGKVENVRFDEDRTWRYLTEEEAKEAKVADHFYWRPVNWFDWGTPVSVSDLSSRFHVKGADQLPTPPTLNRYGTLRTKRDRIETLVQEANEAETVEPSTDGFGPEKESQIQNWVAENIRALNLFNPRKEVQTSVGDIDILADSENGETVIEIKRGRAGDRALGQLLGYMGARTKESESPVEGLLVAEDFTPRVQGSVSALDSVSLYIFDVNTSLKPV